MNNSLANFRSRLIERLVRFLWRQWSALGVAGYARTDDPWIIDPEALLLFSTLIARHDARLFDEILDWLHTNGSWISLQRLGSIHKEESLGDAGILAAIAEHLSKDSAHHKWKVLIRRAETPDSQPAQLLRKLFPGVPVLSEPDPVFLKQSWERGPIELRGMSQSPRPDQAATFLFKLRALFGRQARAEVIAWLLANRSGHPAAIARQTGYFPRTVQLVLNDLCESGHVCAIRSGREKDFSIRPDEWRFLMTWKHEESFPQWISWPPLFKVIANFLETLSIPEIDERSERFQAIQFREFLDSAIPAFKRAGIDCHFKSTPALQGRELIDSVIADMDLLLSQTWFCEN